MVMAIMPLITVAKVRSNVGSWKPGMTVEMNEAITDGAIGASIPKPAMAHAAMLINAHDWRTMRGRGISVKSAPLNPMFSEIALSAKIRKAASMNATITVVVEG